jgi:hypothetical protein
MTLFDRLLAASELLCGGKARMLILNLRASRNCKPIPNQRHLVHVEVFPDYEFSRISRADLFLKHFGRSVERIRTTFGR